MSAKSGEVPERALWAEFHGHVIPDEFVRRLADLAMEYGLKANIVGSTPGGSRVNTVEPLPRIWLNSRMDTPAQEAYGAFRERGDLAGSAVVRLQLGLVLEDVTDFGNVSSKARQMYVNGLSALRIRTVGEALVAGSVYCQGKGFGHLSQTRLAATLRRQCPKVPFIPKLGPADIAWLYDTLDDVPLAALCLRESQRENLLRYLPNTVGGALRAGASMFGSDDAEFIMPALMQFAVPFTEERERLTLGGEQV